MFTRDAEPDKEFIMAHTNAFTAMFVGWFLVLLSSACHAQEIAPYPPAPESVSSVGVLVGPEEPGDRLVITGTVYTSDGKTPYAGLVLYLYQTDADGVYNKTDRSWRRPRIHGWVRTDDRGRYEIRTIKPGSYPGSKNATHIHVIVRLPGEQPTWIDDFLFDGDPHLSARDRDRYGNKGNFSSIIKTTKGSDGTLRGVRDIKLSVKP
jgi:protocatechuate 3,4-dioxygenase beta subunit